MDAQVSIPPPPPPPPPSFFAETTTPQVVIPPPPPPQSVTTIAPPPTTTTVAPTVTNPSSQDRIWLHPWTVTEMRENASQWSLAGDAGLLLYLEQFSDKLIQRADAIQQHLSQTVNAVKSTHTRVQNCLNEFTSLANTQFIENRVYDEDETVDTTASKKDEQSADKTNVSNTEAQEKVLQRYVEAIQYGLSILETHFERVETKVDNIQNGTTFDEDDDDGGIPIEPILEPKDPYIFRPLPHLIGTTEFMQDDYVGLGDLLTPHDDDIIDVEQIPKEDSDSALSSSDDGDDVDDEFVVQQVSSAPLVPAGASRPDLANRAPVPSTSLTDSENEDDPFGLNTGPKFDDFSTKKNSEDNDLFGEIKPAPKLPKTDFKVDEVDDEDDDMFGFENKKPSQPIIEPKKDDFDSSSLSSKGPDEPEQKHITGVSMFGSGAKGMSELEKAILKRRKTMGDPDLPPDDDDNEDEFEKPNKTISSIVVKTTTKPSSNQPSSTTISNLTSTPLSTTEKTPKSSIFNQPTTTANNEDDDGDDFFNDAPKLKPSILPTTTTITTTSKPPTIIPPKKEKDIFGDITDDEDDPFKPPIPKGPTKVNTIPIIPPVRKQNITIASDESEDDELFPSKNKTPSKTTTSSSTAKANEKTKSASSDDEPLFSKPTQTSVSKNSSNENPLSTNIPPVKSSATSTAPLRPPVTKPTDTDDDDSDKEIFGISTTKPKAGEKPPQLDSPTKPNNKEDPLRISSAEQKAQTVLPPSKPTNKNDETDDEDFFGTSNNKSKLPSIITKPLEVKLPPPPQLLTFPDPLGADQTVKTSVEPVKSTSVTTVKKKEKNLFGFSDDDDDDEEELPKKEINPEAPKDGKNISVKDAISRLKIPVGAPGAARPKPSSVVQEPSKPAVDDDENQPVKTIPPPSKTQKKSSEIGTDDDSDDGLFKITKPIQLTPSPVQKKDTPNTEIESGKANMKNISSIIGANLIIRPPGASPPAKPISNEEKEPDSTEAPKEESTMLTIAKDRTRVAARGRAPPTRKPRSTGTAAAVSVDETDDLFALPTSTNTTTSSTATPPPPAPVQVATPPPAPVTGLLNNTAAIAAKSNKQINTKEKKKFSLFDSDNSDTDDLLFGSNRKNKTPVVSKPTTTTPKTTTKSSILALDDDDDFLSKRPVKKSTKPVDNDDIFADVKGKSQPTNKAKKDWSIMNKSATDDQDDIFNDIPSKSSATTKSKPTNVKTKSTKDLDDIFDDPLNVSSKR